MTCPSCGSFNEAGRKFCGECGTKLAAACPSCGTANAPGVRFCGECGTALEAGTAARGSGAGPRTPGGQGSGTGGPALHAPAVAERRHVTILFADLVGWTTITEGRDPEEARDLLTVYFDVAREVIERYGGTVEKFIGDAVMAVWGAPTAHEDDAERGVRAALDLLEAIPRLAPGLDARAGVLTGEAAVTLGAQNQGMVAGDLVNTASRLQSAAPAGTVLVGEATQRAAHGAVVFEPAGEQLLKGKTSPVPAWRAVRVIGERGGRGRGDRLEAPFVGRDSELRLLKDLFHATAREKRLRIVSITGPAGIGKSRLAWELLKYADGVVEPVYWHEGRSPSYGEGVTFWALGEMVRSRAGLLETDDVATTREKTRATVERFVPEAERERVERALLALLGVGEAPPGGAEELFGAWRTYFERMTDDGRMVALVFADLHWADTGTLDFIDHVLEWSRNVPILIVTLARPELLATRPGWGAGRRNFLALDLEPLNDEAMRDLLTGFVPGLPDVATRSIIARADGIPLYAVETVRMLVADGRLREREGGGFEPVGELGELSVPETLQALIAARLDGLDPADRALVQDAAVLGQSFTPAGLAAVAGISEDVLVSRLRGLAKADLIREDTDPRSPERGQFAFVQALIREVAYGTLSLKDRRSRHLAAARFFESLGEDELAGALAAHYLAAFKASPAGPEADALAAQARVSLRAAADRAIGLGAPRQAVSFLEQAIEVATDDAERADILERATDAANDGADLERATVLGAQLVELRRALGDRARLARAYQIVHETGWQGRNREQAVADLEARLAELDDLADLPEVVRMTGTLAFAIILMGGRYERGAELADRALAAAERLGLADVAVVTLTSKAQAAFYSGRLWEAIALGEGALRLAEQRGLARESIRVQTSLTSILALDDPRATAEAERQVLELARRLGRREAGNVMLGNMAEDILRTGDWDGIIRELEAESGVDDTEMGSLILTPAISIFRAYRGQLGPEELAELRDRTAGLEDRDVAASVYDIEGAMAMSEGRFGDAARAWLTNADASELNAPYALPKAGLASVLDGDARTAKLTLDRLAASGARGRAIESDMAKIRAGLAALEGDLGAARAGFAAARAAYLDLGLRWDVALTGLAAGIRLGVDDPEVRGWVTETAVTFRDLRTPSLLAMTERLLETPAGTRRAVAVPSSTPAG